MRTSDTKADGASDGVKAYVKYRYNYGGTVKMILNYLLEFFTNLIFTVLVLIAVVALIALLTNIHPLQIVQRIVGSVLMIAWSALAVLHIVLTVMPKSIQLTDYSIRLKRYNYPHLFSVLDFPSYGFNDCVPLSSIHSVERCYDIRLSDNYRYDFAPSYIFCTDKVVKITDKSGHKYYFPVDDPDALIREIQMRMDKSAS